MFFSKLKRGKVRLELLNKKKGDGLERSSLEGHYLSENVNVFQGLS